MWGREAQPGWVIGISGDLGAGKTHLVKGIATGLGLTERIQSPTFALINEHRAGRLPLFHIDLYRLKNASQIIGAGLEDYLFTPDGVTVVEWFERWIDEGGERERGFIGRRVNIRILEGDEREIIYEDFSH
jgi:tRNA threonylcarbamoyladenosine biosynthesis protein TsaE